jgi:Ran GTPase-activating protein (RanGAP) involved in mRNA processing and transport
MKTLQSHEIKLEYLYLGWNPIGNEGIKYLARGIRNENCLLKTLNLQNINIGCLGINYIASALESNQCKFESLNLTDNYLCDKSAIRLSSAIGNKYFDLEELYLNGSGFTCRGREVLRLARDLRFEEGMGLLLELGEEEEESLFNGIKQKRIGKDNTLKEL